MKRLIILLFILCAGTDSSQNLTSSLQACYPFDGNAQNSATTGSALNGTLVNVFPTTGHTNLANTAYRFNGTVGSYIALPDHPGLKNNDVFFSGWFRIDSIPDPNAFPSISYLVYTSNGCGSNFEAYSLDLQYAASGGILSFCLSKCGSNCGTKPQITSTIVPVAATWYHVCYYISNSVMKLYVNGALQASVNHSVLFGYQPGKNVYLGVTNESNFNKPFKGAVDNVKFYNRDLTQQEITMLYTQDPGCGTEPLTSFSGPQKSVCRGTSITFTDQSSNSPTSWTWSFPGGNPSTSTSSNPTVFYPSAGTYTVSHTAFNSFGSGNVSVQTVTVSSCVSIKENTDQISKVNIYPNPAVDRIYVEGLKDNSLFIYDLLGRTINYEKNFVKEDVSDISLSAIPGIYFVRVINPQGDCQSTIKLVLAGDATSTQ